MADDGTGEVKAEANVINLVVMDQQSAEVHFKVKRHTKLGKVMAAYCSKKELDQSTVNFAWHRFVYDSLRITEDQTPEQLEMEDGDSIDVFIAQLGGMGPKRRDTA